MAPAGTVTVGGTVATVLSLDKLTVASAGAATESTTTPLTGSPPGTTSMPSDTACTLSRPMTSVALLALPEYGSVAVIATVTGDDEGDVSIGKICDVSPAGTSMTAGTRASALSLVSASPTPPE